MIMYVLVLTFAIFFTAMFAFQMAATIYSIINAIKNKVEYTRILWREALILFVSCFFWALFYFIS